MATSAKWNLDPHVLACEVARTLAGDNPHLLAHEVNAAASSLLCASLAFIIIQSTRNLEDRKKAFEVITREMAEAMGLHAN